MNVPLRVCCFVIATLIAVIVTGVQAASLFAVGLGAASQIVGLFIDAWVSMQRDEAE